jgi:hypothetical protein
MHITGIVVGQVPPISARIALRFDEWVNVLVGPNASGKSTILHWINEHQSSVLPDSEFEECATEGYNGLFVSEDWYDDNYRRVDRGEQPPVVHIGHLRTGVPGLSEEEDEDNEELSSEILAAPFTGARLKQVIDVLRDEVFEREPAMYPNGQPDYFARGNYRRALELGYKCTKEICNEVITGSSEHNYVHGPNVQGFLDSVLGGPDLIPMRRAMGIQTNDIRNFDRLDFWDQPSESAYYEADRDSLPIYVGHLSSGTQGTLLWVWWLALKIVHHYDFRDGWEKKPAVLLIDEIENHLHPTWQRRVIPALLEHFPGLQIFATTHSPFVVAGLKAGQVHLLNRDENGVVTASTNEQDIIGWTADEILRTMMGVPDPTDDETARAAEELRRLRNGGPAATEAEEQERQERILELRRKVDRDLLAGGPMAAQREIFEENLAEILERYRQSQSLNQENG